MLRGPLMIILVLLTQCLLGQDSEPESHTSFSNVTIKAGFNNGAFRDFNFSPLIYKKAGAYFGVEYEKYSRNGQNLFLVGLDYLGGVGSTTASDSLSTSYIDGGIELAWLRKLKEYDNVSLFVGAGYSSVISFTEFNNVFEAFTFTIAHSLGFNSRFDWKINKRNHLKMGLSVPLISLLVRPPYSGYDDELQENLDHPIRLITNGEWVTVNSFFYSHLHVEHEFHINDRCTTHLEYVFRYQQAPSMKQFNHQISAGLSYKF